MFRTYIVPALILIFGSIAALSVMGIFAVAHANAAHYLTGPESREALLFFVGTCFASCIACAIVSHFDRVE